MALTEARSARRELDSGKLPPLVVAPDGAGPGGHPKRMEFTLFSWVQCCLRAISQTRFSCLAVIGNRWESFLAGAEDFAGEGEEGAGFVVPLDDAFQTPGGFLGLLLGHLLEQGFEAHEAVAAGFQTGHEALADEAGDEGLEHVLGTIVTGGAFAVLPVALDGIEVFEGAQALADGAHAEAEAGGDGIHGEGFCRGEEESVDGTNGSGVAEEVGQVGEDLSQAVGKLHLGGLGGGRGEVCGG